MTPGPLADLQDNANMPRSQAIWTCQGNVQVKKSERLHADKTANQQKTRITKTHWFSARGANFFFTTNLPFQSIEFNKIDRYSKKIMKK